MRTSRLLSVGGVQVTLLAVCTSCSLSADLDSLTSGGPRQSGDAGPSRGAESSDDEDNDGVPCSPASCTSGESASTRTESEYVEHTIGSEEPIPPSPTWDAGVVSTSDMPTLGDASLPIAPGSEASSAPSQLPPPQTTATSESAISSTEQGTPTCGQGANCESEATVVHRYSFTSTTTVVDSVGGAEGTVAGNASEGSGSFIFDGETYIELPTRVLDGRENVTLEVWFTSYHTRNWERVLDVGNSDDGRVSSYLFLTPQTPSANGTMRVAFRADGESEISIDSAEGTSDNLATHVAIVFDGAENQILLYHDGELSASETTQGSLQDVNVTSIWLGRSLFDGDPMFEGALDEFRVYDGLLSADGVRRSFQAGPDALAP